MHPTLRAGMAELVDAADSKSVACEGVSVRFRLSVPARNSKKALIDNNQGFFYGSQNHLQYDYLVNSIDYFYSYALITTTHN